MTRRVRRQIYLDPRQDAALKRQAAETGASEAEIIRQAIDNQMGALRYPEAAAEAWEREMEFIRRLMQQGAVTGQRTWRREDLHDRPGAGE